MITDQIRHTRNRHCDVLHMFGKQKRSQVDGTSCCQLFSMLDLKNCLENETSIPAEDRPSMNIFSIFICYFFVV